MCCENGSVAWAGNKKKIKKRFGMTHSQRRIVQEPVGGTLLCRACHLTVLKLLVQLAPPPPPPTTSSHLMQKNKLGVSALECALHKQTWSRATQSACRTILGWMIQIGGHMLLQQIAKIQIHPSGAIFFPSILKGLHWFLKLKSPIKSHHGGKHFQMTDI